MFYRNVTFNTNDGFTITFFLYCSYFAAGNSHVKSLCNFVCKLCFRNIWCIMLALTFSNLIYMIHCGVDYWQINKFIKGDKWYSELCTKANRLIIKDKNYTDLTCIIWLLFELSPMALIILLAILLHSTLNISSHPKQYLIIKLPERSGIKR